jgi:hypothetical protein
MSQADDLRARVLREAAATPSLTRSQHRRRLHAIAVVGAAATTGLFFAMGGFSLETRPLELVVFTAGVGLLAALVMTRLSAGKPRSMLGRPRSILLTACVVVAPALALVALIAARCWPSTASEAVPEGAHLACAAFTLAQGALPLIVLLIPRRGTDPVHPAIAGAALGMTAGAWTAMMAYLRCPHAAGLHCVLAHVAPTVVLTLLGAGLGWFFLGLRRR